MTEKKDAYLNNLYQRQEENRTVRRIVIIILSLLLITFAAVIVGGYFYIKNTLEPVNPENDKKVQVSIPIGSSTTSIGKILEEENIIKDATAFRYYVKYKNETDFQAGDYEFSPSMSLDQIIAKLKNGKVMKEVVAKITVPEGIWVPDVAKRIAKATDSTQEEVMAKLNDKEYVKSLINTYPFLTEEIMKEDIKYPLEGYLFPATYEFSEEPTIEKAVQTMLKKTQSVLGKYQDQIDGKNYNIHEIMTLASLIEEEATQKADREKISSVFYNRIEQEMPLQTDPTILYALGRHSASISKKDLGIDSPYSTYKNRGLPIGPIANPGEASIKAAVSPADTDYLYFYARPTGEVYFSKTNAEHNKIRAKYDGEWEEYRKKQKEKNN
ncbi:endolytic transglycosylase MltG [Pseudalkalibacillus caeni]|uniref:Endolytic murein transglycosylase n=1 Tax=Exobacillus caeni TaxID=2574798 RepID=A0A5R9F9V9_9BACL|nr:endolytic transglycosylase MltG [Pseudalkalibacillus caeni]TLS39299.1 endolytic transglycosylase MltG [Pseudalkalibacillus caeni]